MTRRHHPLVGRRLEVVRGGREAIVVRLADGTPMKIPRDWTDVDGRPEEAEPSRPTLLSVAALRELTALVRALEGRDDDERSGAAFERAGIDGGSEAGRSVEPHR